MKFKTPELAKGTVIPTSFLIADMKEEKEKRLREEDRFHDWAIAIFSFIAGIVATIIFHLLTR